MACELLLLAACMKKIFPLYNFVLVVAKYAIRSTAQMSGDVLQRCLRPTAFSSIHNCFMCLSPLFCVIWCIWFCPSSLFNVLLAIILCHSVLFQVYSHVLQWFALSIYKCVLCYIWNEHSAFFCRCSLVMMRNLRYFAVLWNKIKALCSYLLRGRVRKTHASSILASEGQN